MWCHCPILQALPPSLHSITHLVLILVTTRKVSADITFLSTNFYVPFIHSFWEPLPPFLSKDHLFPSDSLSTRFSLYFNFFSYDCFNIYDFCEQWIYIDDFIIKWKQNGDIIVIVTLELLWLSCPFTINTVYMYYYEQ